MNEQLKRNKSVFRSALQFVICIGLVITMLTSTVAADAVPTSEMHQWHTENGKFFMNLYAVDSETQEPVSGVKGRVYRDNTLGSDLSVETTTNETGVGVFDALTFTIIPWDYLEMKVIKVPELLSSNRWQFSHTD